MTYSNNLINKIILNIKNKKYTDTEIIKIFNISRKSYYNRDYQNWMCFIFTV